MIRSAIAAATLLSCLGAIAADVGTGPRAKGDDRKAAEWVLSKGGNVTLVSRDKATQVGAGQALPPGPFQLTRVFIQNTEAPSGADPADLSTLFGPKPLTAADLAVLAGLSKLEDVFVQGVAASPEFFDTLKTLPKLRTLQWLGDDSMKDEHMRRFQELPPLEGIRLEMNQTLTATGLAALVAAQPGLVSLNLKHGMYLDDAVPHLLKLRKLKTLDIPWTNIKPAVIGSLAALPELVSLTLSADQCSAGLDWSKFTKLTFLRISFDENEKLADSGLENLAHCRKLETLHLEGSDDISLLQMRIISGLRGLRNLVFHGMIVPDRSWANLVAMPKLESLMVSAVHPFSDKDLMDLAACRSLKRITVQGATLTEAGVAAFKKKRGDVAVTQ